MLSKPLPAEKDKVASGSVKDYVITLNLKPPSTTKKNAPISRKWLGTRTI